MGGRNNILEVSERHFYASGGHTKRSVSGLGGRWSLRETRNLDGVAVKRGAGSLREVALGPLEGVWEVGSSLMKNGGHTRENRPKFGWERASDERTTLRDIFEGF